MKNRIESRFPNPIRSRMKALNSPTLSGTGAGDDLAIRAQALYARIAGKLKLDAQIDFLNSLRMWCPFYGCTFFEVQCQYDYSPLDSSSTPPVLMMTAAIGPLALFLITTSDPPVIMRHPYKRIIKWIAHPDKHIFTYWVIKAEVTLSDIEDMQQQHSGNGDFDARPYCDCVYLVTSQVKELEYLVQSYVASRRRVSPHLPGAPDELKDIAPEPSPRTSEEATSLGNAASTSAAPSASTSKPPPPPPSAQPAYPAMQRRASRLGVFLSALGGAGGGSGSGLTEEEHVSEDNFGDDTAAVNNSLFKNMYKAPTGTRRGGAKGGDSESEDEDATLKQIPAGIKYASTMSELQKVASETNFSDDEDSQGEDDEPSSDEEDGPSSRAKKTPTKGASNGRSPKRSPNEMNTSRPSSSKHVPPPPPPPQRRASLLAQASGMLFGSRGNNDNDDDESGGDSDSSGDNDQRKLKGKSRSKANKRQDSDEECD